MLRLTVRTLSLVLLTSLLGSGVAAAQAVGTASIIGRLTDETGATLPGVTVTITSPALQLPQMTSVSLTDGQYRFTEIPIGVYTVRYELTGFQGFVHEGIRLTAGFVARLDVVLKIGAVSESLIVSGQSPVVDTSTTAGIVNFTKEMLQSVPNTRSMWQILAMTPGVRPAGTPDVGGSQLGIQQGYKNYGTSGQVTPQLEGINTRQADSTAGFFYDYAALEEAQVKAVGNDAEVALPGTNWIAIVKSGGNDFHGQAFFSGEHSSVQSNNIDDALRANGVTAGNPLRFVTDGGVDLGGRIIRDRLWFYGALRDQRRQNEVIGYLQDAGRDGQYGTADDTQGFQDLILTNQTIKGTLQASQNNRVIGFFQRNLKDEPQSTAGRFVPFEATYNYDFPTQATKAEWQHNRKRVLFDLLAGRQWYDANRFPQDGTNVKGNPRRQNRETTFVTGPNPTQLRPRSRWQATGSVSLFPESFLGGNHSIKGGYQIFLESVGTAWPSMAAGDYTLIYDRVNGVPFQPAELEAYNNPILSPVNKETQYSLFVQDKWVLHRQLTLNLGVRWDRYHAFVDEQTKTQGVFGDSGTFPYVDVLTWKSAAPRVAAAWDVTGTGKSVVKATYGYFTHVMTEDFAQNFNLNARTTYRFRWRDTNGNNDYDPGEVDLRLNGGADFISATGAANNILNPDLTQPVTHEVSLAFERELARNLSAKALYVYKRQNNQYEQVNILRPYSAWNSPITRVDPGPDGAAGNADDGQNVTFYTYGAAFNGSAFVGNQFLNAPDDRDDDYDTLEFTFNKRMSNRWDMLTSYSITKNHRWIRATPNSPNDEFFPLDETLDWQFKLTGTYQMPWDVYASAVFSHLAGDPLQRTYIFRSVPQASTVTLRLEPLGESREPNLNVLNLRGAKKFMFGRRSVSLDFDVFNALNTNSATTITSASGPTFGAISVIVPPRIARFGLTFAY